MPIPLNFSRWSLRSKIVSMIMLSSVVCLLVSLSVMVISSVTSRYQDSLHDLTSLADVLSENGQAALTFSDQAEARRLLESLKQHTEMSSAWLVTADEAVLSSWSRDGIAAPPPHGYKVSSRQLSSDFWSRRASLYTPVTRGDEKIGYVLLQADFTEQWGREFADLGKALGGAVAALLVVFMLATRLQHALSRPIKELADTARAITYDKTYELRVPQHTNDEIGELVLAFNDMLNEIQERDAHLTLHRDLLEDKVAKRTAELLHSKEEAEAAARSKDELNAIGIALSSERDINRLLEIILVAAKRITNADAGTLYSLDAEKQVLRFEIIRTDSLGIAMGGVSGKPITFGTIPLYDGKGKPNFATVVAYAALTGKTVNIPDAYTAEGYDFSGTKAFDQKTGYRSTSFLTVPMRDHDGEIIGVLQLINALDRQSNAIVPFTPEDAHLTESLASQAAIALSNRRLMAQLEELFEAFIRMINTAIDDKSPYTSGHCARVPVLTMMLAEAVNKTDSGPLKDFMLSDKDRRELRIAGLLHDCGKITTPVHVVDKATKLETIFDRIHLVDTRFEVLKRDAEIAMLRALHEDLGSKIEDRNAETIRADYEARIRQLDDDREFLRHCNIGGEAMSDEAQQRVRQIAAYQWRDAEGKECNFLSDSELENFAIRAGTLTPSEREIINHHIDITIKMLDSLPWPAQLKNVTEYAGGHHERMDGKGYPRGLTREQMSVQARMMGIADIFEALTAKDRPYKKGKTLTESLTILGKFKLGGHIDPDLFDVFVREKVYLDYAKQFLSPEQIDDVDLSKIPGINIEAESPATQQLAAHSG